MIIDLEKFVRNERPYWTELESMLSRLEDDLGAGLSVDEAKRLHYLYQRSCTDLAKVGEAAEPELRQYLESVIARAYGEIHESRRQSRRFRILPWFMRTFPQTFRRHARAFRLALATTLVGCAFGAAAIALDPVDKSILLPFEHLQGSPAERVANEEKQVNQQLEGHKITFSGQLMTHNTQVAILCMALGITFGFGTLVLLFYNGVILGAVSYDYIMAGQSKFLLGWLLPHGVIEIPAILLAGQCGFMLASVLLSRSGTLSMRMRTIWGDLSTLMGGVALMLVWAGLVEALLSQYHEPVLPYSLKIAFGLLEFCGLLAFLTMGGRKLEASDV